MKNVEQTGTILTLTFRVCGTAKPGTYAVSLSGKAFDNSENKVDVATKAGAVAIAGGLLGDVNSDNVVDGRDLVRLRKYLANQDEKTGESTVVISSYSDVTGDGTVDGRDLIRLRKYLIALDETTGISSVVLG